MKNNRIDMIVEPSLSLLEIAKINALLERDEPKLAKHTEYEWCYECPVCGTLIGKSDSFCKKCGQRIDEKNTGL